MGLCHRLVLAIGQEEMWGSLHVGSCPTDAEHIGALRCVLLFAQSGEQVCRAQLSVMAGALRNLFARCVQMAVGWWTCANALSFVRDPPPLV